MGRRAESKLTMSTQDQAYYRNYCMRAPRPALIRVYAGDDVQEIEIAEEQNWARLGETIAALEPDRIELYSKDETLLRADKRRVPRASGPISIPDVLHSDPETARLMHIANLLHRAHTGSTEIVITKLADIVQLQTEILQKAMSRLERAEEKYLAVAQENAQLAVAGSEDEENPIVDAFMQGMTGVKP